MCWVFFLQASQCSITFLSVISFRMHKVIRSQYCVLMHIWGKGGLGREFTCLRSHSWSEAWLQAVWLQTHWSPKWVTQWNLVIKIPSLLRANRTMAASPARGWVIKDLLVVFVMLVAGVRWSLESSAREVIIYHKPLLALLPPVSARPAAGDLEAGLLTFKFQLLTFSQLSILSWPAVSQIYLLFAHHPKLSFLPSRIFHFACCLEWRWAEM